MFSEYIVKDRSLSLSSQRQIEEKLKSLTIATDNSLNYLSLLLYNQNNATENRYSYRKDKK